jgi:hypothetical protein
VEKNEQSLILDQPQSKDQLPEMRSIRNVEVEPDDRLLL